MAGRSFRVSISGLLAVVLVMGMGFAALSSPSPMWQGVVSLAALGTLTAAVIACAFGRDPDRRARAGGFAVAGWMYWILTMAPVLESSVGHRLATTAALDILYDRVKPQDPSSPSPMLVGGMSPGMGTMLGGGSPGAIPPSPTPPTRWQEWNRPNRQPDFILLDGISLLTPGPFLRIGHGLFSLLAGLGGWLVVAYARRRPAADPSR